MSQHLITTTATIHTCHQCGALLLTGIAEGLTARVDITPITDEPATIQAGRWTYNLRAGQLDYRDEHHRRHPPTGPVLADHNCPHPRQPALW